MEGLLNQAIQLRGVFMEKNWVLEEAKKADLRKGYIILENPEIRRYLDDLLLKEYWPSIWSNLEDSDYNYHPQDTPETEFERKHVLTRSLTFMLLDERKAFFRGKLSCSIEHWMIESEHFLSLSKDTDPQIIFEILGNSRFVGYPPELSIDKAGDDFYQITFHAGKGEGWGMHGEQYIVERIKKVFDINIAMHKLSSEGVISASRVGELLTTAYEVYEAY
ncbi:MAG TPA: hypothetical protein DCP92_18350 [Nitrospiraceae bacterium]|jgi:hypothetical protein|nr:hypothetical protein [Nitrospiraceae bacterium]